jgi:Cys-tRNA(Pro)/Cys-tRNA(Cys) deacylase
VHQDGGHSERPRRTPLAVLEAAEAKFAVLEHVPIIGQEDAERELDVPVERLLKTMVFCAGETKILVALPVHGRVNYGKLAKAIGIPRGRLRQAEPADLRALGMQPGGASPVCGVDGVITVFDAAVPGMGTVYCGSGRPDRTVEVEATTLIDVVAPIIAPVTKD